MTSYFTTLRELADNSTCRKSVPRSARASVPVFSQHGFKKSTYDLTNKNTKTALHSKSQQYFSRIFSRAGHGSRKLRVRLGRARTDWYGKNLTSGLVTESYFCLEIEPRHRTWKKDFPFITLKRINLSKCRLLDVLVDL